jgi:fucose permease
MISQESALAASAVLGCLLTVTIGLANPSSSSLWESLFGWLGVPAIPDAVFMVALLGLANALVWPAVWPLALRGLNQAQTGTGSALLIMGIAGGALIPLLFGALADLSSDPRAAYWLLLPCYLFVLHYAVFGHKKTRWGR